MKKRKNNICAFYEGSSLSDVEKNIDSLIKINFKNSEKNVSINIYQDESRIIVNIVTILKASTIISSLEKVQSARLRNCIIHYDEIHQI